MWMEVPGDEIFPVRTVKPARSRANFRLCEGQLLFHDLPCHVTTRRCFAPKPRMEIFHITMRRESFLKLLSRRFHKKDEKILTLHNRLLMVVTSSNSRKIFIYLPECIPERMYHYGLSDTNARALARKNRARRYRDFPLRHVN
jgi:hypothetical protein